MPQRIDTRMDGLVRERDVFRVAVWRRTWQMLRMNRWTYGFLRDVDGDGATYIGLGPWLLRTWRRD